MFYSEEELSKRLYLSNKESWNKSCNKNFLCDQQLTVQKISPAVILPTIPKKNGRPGEYTGGVCDLDGNFISGFQRGKKNDPGVYGSVSAYNFNLDSCDQVNEDVIFGGVVVGHFGHFILEGFARLWYVLQNPTQTLPIVFCTVFDVKNYFFDFFQLFGIEDRVFFCKKPTIYNSVLIPDESIHSWHQYYKEYAIPYEFLKAHIKPSNVKKIYLTRSQYKDGGCTIHGEKYFEDFFASHGYQIIAPENLPVIEQIALLSGAEEVCTTLGSISHLALFCKPKTKLILMPRDPNDFIAPQTIINEVTHLDWYYVDTTMNFMPCNRTYGPVLLNNTEYFRKFIKDFYNENINDHINKSVFYDYLIDFLSYYGKFKRLKKIEKLSMKDLFLMSYHILIDKNYNDKQINDILSFKLLNDKLNKQKEFYKNKLGHYFILYELHYSDLGWLPEVWQGVEIYPIFTNKQLEAIKISCSNPNIALYYATLTQNGWSTYVKSGEMSGSTGKHLALKGLKIKLEDSISKQFSIFYRIYRHQDGWTQWICNDNTCLSNEQCIESIEIQLLPVDKNPNS